MLRKHSTWRTPFARGARRAALAMGLALAAGVATAGAASAGRLNQQSCIGEPGRYTICVYITAAPPGGISHSYDVYVDIDVNMHRDDAQRIIDGGGSIGASMYGSDLFSDNHLASVTRRQLFAWEGGLSAGFQRRIQGSVLDEDWEGEDEVYALVRLYVPVSGATRTFRSDQIDGYFFGGPLG